MLRYAERHQPKMSRAVSKRYGDGWGERFVQPGFRMEFPFPTETPPQADITLPEAPDVPSVSVSESEGVSESESASDSGSGSDGTSDGGSDSGSESVSDSASDSSSTSESGSGSDSGGGGGGGELCCMTTDPEDLALYMPYSGVGLEQADCIDTASCCGGARFQWGLTGHMEYTWSDAIGNSQTVVADFDILVEIACVGDSISKDQMYNTLTEGTSYTWTVIRDQVDITFSNASGYGKINGVYSGPFKFGGNPLKAIVSAGTLLGWMNPAAVGILVGGCINTAHEDLGGTGGFAFFTYHVVECPGNTLDADIPWLFSGCYACGDNCTPCGDSRDYTGNEGTTQWDYVWSGGAACATGGYLDQELNYVGTSDELHTDYFLSWEITRLDDACCIGDPGAIVGAQECCNTLAASSYCDTTPYETCSAHCAATDADGQPLCCCKRGLQLTPGVYHYSCRYCADP